MRTVTGYSFHLLLLLLFFGVLFCSPDALAKSKAKKSQPNEKYASIVMDADTGLILSQSNPDKIVHPASLTKVMTMLMAFEAIDSGRMQASTKIRISERAAGMAPSKLGLAPGTSIKLSDALYALATKSANDIAAAVAENIGRSESEFAAMMTRRARDIGMTKTTFRNASGLPDQKQVTTARDMAKLARYILIRYPHHYHYFGTKQFTYRGVTYNNHNKLLGVYKGADGFKTGYINASGFNLIASAKRNGNRIIGVVFGGRSGATRDAHMVDLLDRGFGKLADVRVAAAAAAPVPSPKPVINGTQTAPASSYTSLSALENDTRVVVAQKQPAKTISDVIEDESIGQGDYEPIAQNPYHDTQLASLTEEKSPDSSELDLEESRLSVAADSAISSVPSDRWSIQIGAYSSRAQTDYALRKALGMLPGTLNQASPIAVPLRTAEGLLYRARIIGYDRNEAQKACSYFKDCMMIAP